VVGGAIGGFLTLYSRGRQGRQRNTYHYLERLDSEAMQTLMLEASTIWELGPGEEVAAARARYDALGALEQAKIYRTFNFWEDVCFAYIRKLFDDAVFREALAPILMQDWRAAHWLVTWLRTSSDGTKDMTIWEAWQKVYCKMLCEGVPFTLLPDTDPDDGCDGPADQVRWWSRMFGIRIGSA
jgi:hypothetical protein